VIGTIDYYKINVIVILSSSALRRDDAGHFFADVFEVNRLPFLLRIYLYKAGAPNQYPESGQWFGVCQGFCGSRFLVLTLFDRG
jgi:hypothetical protein